MAGEPLLDTGALAALLDRSQCDHAACTGFLVVGGALPVPATPSALGRARQSIDQDASVYRIRGRRRFRIVPDDRQ